MKKLLLLVFLLTLQMQITAQTTYVPDDNFEQALIDLGYDDVLDDYVLTVNINRVTILDVHSKKISNLTGIEDFTSLTELECFDNQLSTLDTSQNTALIHLNCLDNQLSALDVSQNIMLEELYCYYNQLTELDISQNTELTYLCCNDNQITSLDITHNTELYVLWCYSNQLNILDVSNGHNRNLKNYNFQSYNNPNLTCIFTDAADWSNNCWTHIDPVSTFVETLAECDALGIDEVFLSEELQVYPNPAKNQLFINNPNNLNIQSIQIYNILGKLVMQQHNNLQQIDVSLLKPGVYLIKIETDRGVIAKKVLKE